MQKLTTTILPALLLVTTATAQELRPLESRIDAATVYGSSARVTRVTAEVTSDGRYLLSGLTSRLDRENVRVRASSGRVLGVEVRERLELEAPEERVEALRVELRQLEREEQARGDEIRLMAGLRQELEGQLAAPLGDEEQGMPSLEAWSAAHEVYSASLAELLRAERELGWEAEEARLRLAAVREELGRHDAGHGVRVHDVLIDVDLGAGPATLEVEYFVSGCGWSPVYDLRTAGDARSVDLVYRAEVRQESGEDWSEVEVALSTAKPRRGAAGPEPEPRWVDLGRARRATRERGRMDIVARKAERAKADFAMDEKRVFAAAQDAGLSVRFVLPRRESLVSRDVPTTVLVGEESLAVEPELHCVPALAEEVWLRGRALNTSPWILLPGRAAVFFGEDFIGHASVGEVRTGQELELALGVVPGLKLERTLLGEEHVEPGFLSSTAKERERWRVRLSNHGSPVTESDGGVAIVVREAIPRSRDERLEVEVTESSHRISDDERWKADLEDRSFLTWVVPVPAGGETDLTWELTLSHPESREVILD